MRFTLALPLLAIATTSTFARNIDLHARADASAECGLVMAKYDSCIDPLLKLSEGSSELKTKWSNIKDVCTTYKKSECQDVYKNSAKALAGCESNKIKELTETFNQYTPIMDILCVTDEDGKSCPANEIILNTLNNNTSSESSFTTVSAVANKTKRQENSTPESTSTVTENKTPDVANNSTTTTTTATPITDSESNIKIPLIDVLISKNKEQYDFVSERFNESCYSSNCREAAYTLVELIKKQVPEGDTPTYFGYDAISLYLRDENCDTHGLVLSPNPNANGNSTSGASMKYLYHGLLLIYVLFIAFILV